MRLSELRRRIQDAWGVDTTYWEFNDKQAQFEIPAELDMPEEGIVLAIQDAYGVATMRMADNHDVHAQVESDDEDDAELREFIVEDDEDSDGASDDVSCTSSECGDDDDGDGDGADADVDAVAQMDDRIEAAGPDEDDEDDLQAEHIDPANILPSGSRRRAAVRARQVLTEVVMLLSDESDEDGGAPAGGGDESEEDQDFVAPMDTAMESASPSVSGDEGERIGEFGGVGSCASLTQDPFSE